MEGGKSINVVASVSANQWFVGLHGDIVKQITIKPGSNRPKKKINPRKTAVDITTFANEQLGDSIGVYTARN